MARSLLELYRLDEAGPKGPTLSGSALRSRWPIAAVAFDRDVAPKMRGNPSFRENAGGFLIVSSGGREWYWDARRERWDPVVNKQTKIRGDRHRTHVSIEADIAVEPDELEDFIGSMEKRGLSVEVIDEQGPGGGWPEVRISGPAGTIYAELMRLGWDSSDAVNMIHNGFGNHDGLNDKDARRLVHAGVPQQAVDRYMRDE